MRILLIEDNLLVAQVAKKVLEQFGQTELVGTGEAGLEKLQAAQAEGTHFDAVFMDLGLPGLSGQETLTALRAQEAEAGAAKTPVIMLTGRDDKEAINHCFELGCDYYLVKPLSKDKLTSTLNNLGLN